MIRAKQSQLPGSAGWDEAGGTWAVYKQSQLTPDRPGRPLQRPEALTLLPVSLGKRVKQTESGAPAAQTGVIVNKQSQFPPAAGVSTGSIVRNKANSWPCRLGCGPGNVDQGRLYKQTQSGAPAAQTGVNVNKQSQFPRAAGAGLGSIVPNEANSWRCQVGCGLGDVDQGQLYKQTQSGAPAAQTGVNANKQAQFPRAAGAGVGSIVRNEANQDVGVPREKVWFQSDRWSTIASNRSGARIQRRSLPYA
jgi:hypothetical protein